MSIVEAQIMSVDCLVMVPGLRDDMLSGNAEKTELRRILLAPNLEMFAPTKKLLGALYSRIVRHQFAHASHKNDG